MDNTGFWKVSSTSATVNGNVVHRDSNTAVCDTGTSLCLVDSDLCQAIYSTIPGARYIPLQLLARFVP
jgi:Eukaryotic aspartyl protease